MESSVEPVKTPKIRILNYGLGNLFSVEQAFNFLNADVKVINHLSEIEDIQAIDGLVLPGVGAFGAAMEKIRNLEYDIFIKQYVAASKPFLGICLGLQLLFETSEEFGHHEGLGLVKGAVKRFPEKYQGQMLRVPQISWNRLHFPNQELHKKSALSHLSESDYVYFVHSYYVETADSNIVLSTTNYMGFDYCSSVLSENIFAVQYHPEKSGEKGVQIFKNWMDQIILKQK